ncbi:MAG: ATP-dependent Clp protease proteolytic subunit [Bacteroidota bacterium]
MPNKKEFENYAIKHQYIKPDEVKGYINHAENMTRAVIEERNRPFREIDVFSRLIMDRIIFLGTQVNEEIANIITAQLLFLESVDRDKDITLYINSPGGSIYAGLAMYDTMQYINPDVATVATGLAASMGAVLLAGGKTGKRSCLPHSRIMIHQPVGGSKGQAKDMEITLRQVISLKEDLYNILAKHTGKDFAQIENDADRDYWMRPAEAKEYGIIDHVH